MFDGRRDFAAVVKCKGTLAAETGQLKRPKLGLRYRETVERTESSGS
jgi:hypothetical protein